MGLFNLTQNQIDRLLAFRGYGNPNARFWFVGMEEGGIPNSNDLRIRADRFDTTEDLAKSHTNFQSHNMSKLVPTWRLMSSIVGRIKGEPNWWSKDFAREYQQNRLGKPGDETYLTEILPLPKRGINDWPYGELFGSPKEYQAKVLPDRRDHLRDEYREALPKPEFIFCYGKGLRGEHRDIFDFVDFRSDMDDAIEWGTNQHSVFILTKMFGYGRLGFTKEFVDRLCEFALAKSPT